MSKLKTYFKKHGQLYGKVYLVFYFAMLVYSLMFFGAYPYTLKPFSLLLTAMWALSGLQVGLYIMTIISNIRERFVSCRMYITFLLGNHLVRYILIMIYCRTVTQHGWITPVYITMIAVLASLFLFVRIINLDSIISKANERMNLK
jgi:hypothetical protein